MGGDVTSCSIAKSPVRFNPRPRMGGDRATRKKRKANLVSIHAPAWGATVWAGGNWPDLVVSIHAPAWGATVTIVYTID